MNRNISHILLYGLSGTRKSTLAAQAPSPQYIMLFDSLSNANPYLEGCDVYESTEPIVLNGQLNSIQAFDCYAIGDEKKENLVRRILNFKTDDPEKPEGILKFKSKYPHILNDMKEFGYKTLIVDSLSLFHVQVRHSIERWYEGDQRQVAGVITNYYEDICFLLSNFELNVILISHLSTTTQNENRIVGGKVVQISKHDHPVTTAPGRMASMILSFFSDVWYCHTDREGNFKVLTSSDGEYIAKNSFRAPQICNNSLREIMENSNVPKINWKS